MAIPQIISDLMVYPVAHWQDIKVFFNSVFFTSIAGACAGAYAGARIAQVIVERAKVRETLMAEIRNTNAASMMAFSIFSSLTSLWSQHAKRLKDEHDSQKTALFSALNTARHGQVIEFRDPIDLKTLSFYDLPVDALQRHLFEKVSTQGRPMALAITLGQTAQSLHETIKKRNDLIEMYKASDLTQNQRISHIFGIPSNDGQINNDYSSALDGIYSYTRDGIYFARKLSADLTEHGEEVAEIFRKKFKTEPPPVSKADFSLAYKAGYIPDAKDYEDWDTMFVKATIPKKKNAFKMLSSKLLSICSPTSTTDK